MRAAGLISRRSVVAALAGSAVARSLSAAPAGDFYRGKTLTTVVGFAPGGGVDTAARVIARHLVRFIPGSPRSIAQNLEGAAGIVAANYIATRAAPDGLTIAVPGRSWFVEGVTNALVTDRLGAPLAEVESRVRLHPPEESQAVRAMYRQTTSDRRRRADTDRDTRRGPASLRRPRQRVRALR